MNAKASKFATCRHIKTNGRICQSPAITGAALCYFHRNLHHTHRRPADAVRLDSQWQEDSIPYTFDPTGEDPIAVKDIYPNQDDIPFPPLEDAESVQLATSMLFQAIATGQIQFKRARLLIATLKIACINQRALATARAADADPAAVPIRLVRTAQGQILAAPDQDETAPVEPAGAVEQLEPPAPSSNLTPHSSEPETDFRNVSPTAAEPSAAPVPAPPAVTQRQPSQPSTNSNEKRNLDITHLDTGFCRKPRHASA